MKYVDWEFMALCATVIAIFGGAGFLIWKDQGNAHLERLACIEAGKQIFQGDCIKGLLP